MVESDNNVNPDNDMNPDNNVKPENDVQKPDADDDLSGLPVLRSNVAGIDLASEIHWVCWRKS